MDYLVGTSRELALALKAAVGGDRFLLAGGDYAGVMLKSLTFETPITITSADPANPATLVDASFSNVTGVTVEGLSLRSDKSAGLTIGSGHSIVLDHLDISGTATDKLAGSGVQVRNSSDIAITNSQFHNLSNGLSHLDSSQLTFSGNTFADIRADGIHGGGSSYVTIANNSFTDFYRLTGDHPDAIQFWTSNTKASAHDIIIKDNLIVRGDGGVMQGIFVGDESNGKYPFINVTITGNTVIGSMYNGIAVSQAQNLVLSDNTVVGYQDMRAWILVKDASGATVVGNITSQLTLGDSNTDVTSFNNQIVPLTTADVESYSLAYHMRIEGGGFFGGDMFGGDPFAGYQMFGQGFYAMAPAEPTSDDVAVGDNGAMPGADAGGGFGWFF